MPSPLRLHSKIDRISGEHQNYIGVHGLENGEPTAPEIRLNDLISPEIIDRITQFENQVTSFFSEYNV